MTGDPSAVGPDLDAPDTPGAPDASAASPPGEPGSVPNGEVPAGSAEFAGPRRRARRERAERRALEARARAIEEARRAAKRRARAQQPAQAGTLARGTVAGLKAMMWAVLAAVCAFALGLVLYFSPVMSARTIAIDGISVLPRDEVLAAVAVRPGTPLLQIDTNAVADRVATIRRVAAARVQREYPSTLRVTVTERIPVAVKDFPDGPHLFDRDGVDFATAPPAPGLPYLDVEHPAPADPATVAALDVLTALRPEVFGQVSRIAAPSVASITLTLTDGRSVIWGTADRTEEKAGKLAALLTQPGHIYDVSSPDLPTVK